MSALSRFAGLCAALALVGAVAACAPSNTGSTVAPGSLGQAGYVSYGTIIAARPVAVSGSRSGLGAGAGAVSGGLIGSTIGGDWRARTVAGVAGALIGGVAGAAVEEGVTRGEAVEFIVREDRGGDISVVQTNEDRLAVGERVMVNRADRVRLVRAAPGAGAVPSASFVPAAPRRGSAGTGAVIGAPSYATPAYEPSTAK